MGDILVAIAISIFGVVIVVVVIILVNRKPPVAGLCRLIVRPVAKDYCAGGCAPGVCTATATKPYARFWTQDAACACLPAPAVAPPIAAPPTGTSAAPGSGDIAPITGETHTGH